MLGGHFGQGFGHELHARAIGQLDDGRAIRTGLNAGALGDDGSGQNVLPANFHVTNGALDHALHRNARLGVEVEQAFGNL